MCPVVIVCVFCVVCALAMINAIKAARISVELCTLVSLQEMTKQGELVQISCKAELEKKSVSIPNSVCV